MGLLGGFVLVVGGLGVAAATPLPKEGVRVPSEKVAVQRWCLRSGLAVDAIRRPSMGEVVAVATVVDGGHHAEQRGEAGLAHLVEHLWFVARPGGGPPVREVLAGLGWQGFTMPDATAYVTVGARTDLGPLLNAEALRLLDPLVGVDDAAFATEREVVRAEQWIRDEGGGRLAVSALVAALGGAPEPDAEGLDALTLDSARAYARRVYTPGNTTIRIEGDLDLAAIPKLLEGAWPASLLTGTVTSCAHTPMIADPDPPTGAAATSVVTLPSAVVVPMLHFGWALPAGYGPQDGLGRLAAAWLAEALAYEVGLARGMDDDDVSLSCSYQPGASQSLVWCATPIPSASAAEGVARKVRSKVVEQWRDELTTDRLWVRTKARQWNLALAWADALDDDALADRALYGHFGADRGVDGALVAPVLGRAIAEVEPKALSKFARTWLTGARMAAVAIVPAPAELRPGLTFDGTVRLDAPRDGGWHVAKASTPGWRSEVRPNGLTVWRLPQAGGVPVSYAELAFADDGGQAPVGSPIAHAWLRMTHGPVSDDELTRTTGTLSSAHFYGEPALSAWGPSGNLDAQVFALRWGVSGVTYYGRPTGVREAWLDAAIGGLVAFPELVAEADQRHALLGDVGLPWWEVLRVARTRTRNDAGRWRDAVLTPDQATLILVGALDPGETEAALNTFVDPWTGQATAGGSPPTVPAVTASFRAYEFPRSGATVRLACRLPARDVHNDAALDIIGFLAGEGLRQTLRDPAGLYGIWGQVDADGPVSVLSMEASVPPGGAARTYEAMAALVDTLASGPSPAVLAWASKSLQNRFARDVASAASSLALAEQARGRMTLDALTTYPMRLGLVTAADVSAALADCAGAKVGAYVGPKTELAGVHPEWVPWRSALQGG